MSLNAPRQRANSLLYRMLSENAASVADLAQALMVSPDSIVEYRAGLEMPIERQMLLAAFAIEQGPKFARLGYALRGQVAAAMRFVAGETATHQGPPPASARGGWA